MKWYFVLNEQAHRSYVEVAQVSALSCIRNTTLRPHALYDGKPNDFTAWLQSIGVTVIHATVPFIDALERAKGIKGLVPDAARGAYLRTMIPMVEEEDDFVFYTDTDVLFQHDPSEALSRLKPQYLAATTESEMEDYNFFNSGVMLINVAATRRRSEQLFGFIERELPHWHNFSPNDQGALNYFFRGAWEELDPKLNWKPYWGRADDAYVIHFHGSRPNETLIRLSHDGETNDKSAARKRLFSDPVARETLRYHAGRYTAHLVDVYPRHAEIEDAALVNGILTMSYIPGDESRYYRNINFVLSANGKDFAALPHWIASTTERAPLHLTLGPPDMPAWGADVSVRVREMPYISAPVCTLREGGYVCELGPIQSPEAIPLQEPTGGKGTIVSLASISQRLWTLPGMALAISAVDRNLDVVDDHQAGVGYRGKRDSLWVQNLRNCFVSSAGMILSEQGRIVRHAGGHGLAQAYPAPGPVGPVGLKADALVAGCVDLAVMDTAMPPSERIFNLLAQLAAFGLSPRPASRLCITGGLSPGERRTLDLLDVEFIELGGAGPEWSGFPDLRVAGGSGCLLKTGASAVDRWVRRLMKVSAGAARKIIHLKGAASGEPEAAAIALIGKTGMISETVSAPVSADDIGKIATASLIVIDDPSLAGFLSVAQPCAAVLHIDPKTPAHDDIRHAVSLRNLMYAKLSPAQAPIPPGSPAASEFKTLVRNLVERLHSSCIVTASA